jgi:hypothetical protein
MGIDLWSRREGIVRPAAQVVHAEPGSSSFPPAFRTRVYRWSRDAMRRLQWGTSMGDVVNAEGDSMQRLLDELCSAYGRELLVQYTEAHRRHDLRSADRQLPDHVDICPDLEVMDYIDAVFQISASIIEQQGGADPVEEPHRLGREINKIVEEEGVGYRWTDGRLVRFDAEITHTQAVVPALAALANERFGAAGAEFDEAVGDFGRGAYRDALTNANAALESVLKVLTGNTSGTAGDLIREARRQELLPKPLGASVQNLEKLMHGSGHSGPRGELARAR